MDLHWEGSAPVACAAGLFLLKVPNAVFQVPSAVFQVPSIVFKTQWRFTIT